MGNGIKLLALIFVGFLLIEIGLTGALGSILAAFFIPQYLGAPANQGTSAGQALANDCAEQAVALGLSPGSIQYAVFMADCTLSGTTAGGDPVLAVCTAKAQAKGLTGVAASAYIGLCVQAKGNIP